MLPLKKDKEGKILPIKNHTNDHIITPTELMTFFKLGFHPAERVWKTVLLTMLGSRLRVGEALAINIKDFKDKSFRKFDVLIQKKKNNIIVQKEIPESIAAFLRSWIHDNWYRIVAKEGFIFPSTNNKTLHHTTQQIQNWFCQKRKQLYKHDPKLFSFMMKTMGKRIYKSKNYGNKVEERYVVSSHLMRRFAGTYIYLLTKDPLFTKEMLCHADVRVTQDHYINQATMLQKEPQIINKLFDHNFYDELCKKDSIIPAVFHENTKKA